MRNATGILKLIAQGEEDVRSGKTKSQEEVFEGVETMLKAKLHEGLFISGPFVCHAYGTEWNKLHHASS